ncbi:hypothetical protein ACJJIC_04175 [Microbulbifer sp. ANSA002]
MSRNRTGDYEVFMRGMNTRVPGFYSSAVNPGLVLLLGLCFDGA